MVFDLKDEKERQHIRQALLEYRKLDTLAMEGVYKALLQLVQSSKHLPSPARYYPIGF